MIILMVTGRSRVACPWILASLQELPLIFTGGVGDRTFFMRLKGSLLIYSGLNKTISYSLHI